MSEPRRAEEPSPRPSPAPQARERGNNFYQRFVSSAERFPDRVAVEVQRSGAGPRRLTYRDLHEASDAVARRLAAEGAGPGARCALLAENSPDWVAAYLGTIAAGAVAVPLDTHFNPEQISQLLKDSGAVLLFTDDKHAPEAEKAGGGVPILPLFRLRETAGVREDAAELPVPVAADDTAVIVYTSGTTSDPKGVMLTHRAVAGELDAAVTFVGFGPEDASLGVLPLFHVLSQMASLLLPLAVGARVVFLETASTPELLRALRERDVTVFVCVPQFFYLIHERVQQELAEHGRLARAALRAALRVAGFGRRHGVNLGRLLFARVHALMGPKLRFLVTGGARMDPQVCRDFADMGFTILQAYGLSECSGAAFATPPGENVLGSVGKPLHGIQGRLLDAAPSEEAGGRAVGEVLIAGPTLMKGYFNRPEATAEVLADGWLRTGDLGYFDERGHLFICGRKKEMIVLSSGKNIFPEEIEAHYQKSPFIKELCVVGVQPPGQPASERLHGVIVPDFDALKGRKIVNASEVIRFDVESLSAQLPPTKRILSYELCRDPLPRTTTRKIRRFEVERGVRARQAAPGAPPAAPAERPLDAEEQSWAERPDVARALAVVNAAAKGPRRRAHPKDNIELDLGLDSVERVELAGALQRELGARVDDWSRTQVFTVRELIDAVLAGAGREGSGALGWDAIFARAEPGPEALEITRPRPVTDLLWGAAFRLAFALARVLYRFEVTGLEKLPKTGGFILCPNHQSYLDGPLVIAAMPFSVFQRLFYVGTSEIFGKGLMLRVARSVRLIPIDPDVNMIAAMKAGAYGLSQGRALVLFPEGERSIDGTPKRFKKGAAILSAHLRVPIVPVALAGFADAWPREGQLRWTGRLRMTIGDPIESPAAVEGEATYAAVTADLRARVVSLWETLRKPS